MAAKHLRARGYEVLLRNLRCRRGEIDLVCRRRGVVSLAEVKTRTGHGHGTAFEAVYECKQRAMAATVAEHRSATGWRWPVRFQLVGISIEVVDDVLA